MPDLKLKFWPGFITYMYFVVLVIYVTWPTVLTYFQAEIGNSSQKCRKRGLGGFQFSTDQLKPYSNQEADYAHHITNPPLFDSAASLAAFWPRPFQSFLAYLGRVVVFLLFLSIHIIFLIAILWLKVSKY